MVDVVLRLGLLMQGRDGIGDEIHIDDIDLVGGAKWKYGQSCQEYEGLHHVELRGLRMAAVAENDAGPENSGWSIRKQHMQHVLAKFLGTRIGIVVGAIPFNSAVFGYHFVA